MRLALLDQDYQECIAATIKTDPDNFLGLQHALSVTNVNAGEHKGNDVNSSPSESSSSSDEKNAGHAYDGYQQYQQLDDDCEEEDEKSEEGNEGEA